MAAFYQHVSNAPQQLASKQVTSITLKKSLQIPNLYKIVGIF